MEIRSDRRHRFDVDRAALWDRMTAVEEYQRWWPWLSALHAGALAPGETWRATVRPPLPYVVRFAITIEEVDTPSLVTARIDGDIAGSARMEVSEDGSGSEVRLVSALSPRNRLLRSVAVFARPLVAYGHDWVLDAGFRQFSSRGLRGD